MLLVKSQYKIAKRLGAAIFEKTQSQKFSLSEARTKKPRGRSVSDYGRQLLEKQKVRFTYGLSERQLSNYAHAAFQEKDPSAALNTALEMRADSAVYRAGLASTRRAARQIVSHVREGSRTSPLFASLAEVNPESTRSVPKWISTDLKTLRAEIKDVPAYSSADMGLDYPTVFEFYSR
jgi:small subunit ribosomal protein S4